MSLIEMSLSGSAMLLLAIALRFGLKGRLPGWLMPAVWWATAARLLLPFEIPTPWSIYNLLERETVSETALPLPDAGAAVGQNASVAVHQGAAVQGVTTHSVPWHILWAVGFAACGAALLWFWLDSRRKFRESLPVQTDEVKDWLNRHPLHRKLQVRQSDRIDSPLTYGLLRPVILLPARRDWSQAELECVLTHEYTHIRHLDSLSKLVLLAAACLHWLNPLVWVMVLLANRDLELWCDEGTAGRLGEEQRKVYALTLIRLEEERTFFPFIPSHFTTNPIKERIESIMKNRRISVAATIVALILIVGAILVFATSPKQETDDTEGISTIGGSDGPTDVFVTRDPSDVNIEHYNAETMMDYLQIKGGTNYDSYDVKVYTEAYEAYGLTYDSESNLFYFEGKPVRYFSDFYYTSYRSEEWYSSAGMTFAALDGEVDVIGIRDYSDCHMNMDYGLDSEPTLIGLRLATQEEFDQNTERMNTPGVISFDEPKMGFEQPSSAEETLKRLEEEREELVHQAQEDSRQTELKSADEAEFDLELRSFVESFAETYLEGDLETIIPYLSDTFSGWTSSYSGTAQLEEVSVWHDGTYPDGSYAGATVTLLPEGGDSYEYLSMELVMEEGSWKVSFYGLEK